MIRLLLSFCVVLLSICTVAQSKITGTVKSAVDESHLYNVKVILTEAGEEVSTDRIGYFQFVNLPAGIYSVNVRGVGYEEYTQQVDLKENTTVDLGDIFLTYAPQNIEIGVITLSDDELNSDEASAQSSVGLLQSSKDVFARSAAYELGAYWFRTRGYDNKYNEVHFNGIRMNKIDNDRVDYGNWGGLNDIVRYPAEVTYGIEPSDYVFGDLGGVTYIDTRPSSLRTGTSFSYSLSNRSYRQRLMLTHNTGLNKNGWGFTASASRRWANEGRIPGTFYDAWGYFLGMEKRFNNQHSLHLSVMGAPNRRATNSPNTQEIYDIMGVDYNAYWGYQGGKKRSERVKNTHEPIAILTHYWDITGTSKLTTSVAFQTGKSAASRLDWNGASNPSPIYYRNLPSASNDPLQKVADWKNDTNVSQINWANLYLLNNTISGESKYFLVNDVNEDNTFTFNTNYRNQVSDAFGVHANLSYQKTNSELYREIDDLLGGKYVLDKDDFADPGQSGDYDINHPNKKAYVGDKVQYNYEIDHSKVDAYLSGNYKTGNFDFTLGLKLANTTMQRNGLFDHYRYTNSKGKSDKYNFLDYGVKFNTTYKVNGRNYVTFNTAYYTSAPTTKEAFPQQRENNLSIPNLESAKIFSSDINYILRAPRIKARATAFYSSVKDEIETAFAYLERDVKNYDANLFTAQVLNGIEKQYIGTEIAIEAQLTTTLTATGVASIGQYTYNNNPAMYYFSDAYADKGGFSYEGISYLKNYKLASSPQKGVSVGLQYRSPKYWWIGATGNYLANNYTSLAATRRTSNFFIDKSTGQPYREYIRDMANGGELAKKLLSQQEFDPVFMLNLNGGKTFRFGNYYMGISLSVSNVLNNKNYITGGFEQLRLANFQSLADEKKNMTFGNKYWYNQGASYFLNIFLRF